MTPAPIGLPDDVDDSHVPDLSGPSSPDQGRAREATRVLTAPQRIAAWEIANGSSRAQAARVCGLTERTLYRYAREPWFVAAVSEASAMIVDISGYAPLAMKAKVCERTPEIGDKLVQKALDDDDPDQFRAISKALEVAGLTGTKGSTVQVNNQTNIDNRTQIVNDMDEAQRIIAEVSSGRQASTNA